jgi:hypothetical protein
MAAFRASHPGDMLAGHGAVEAEEAALFLLYRAGRKICNRKGFTAGGARVSIHSSHYSPRRSKILQQVKGARLVGNATAGRKSAPPSVTRMVF